MPFLSIRRLLLVGLATLLLTSQALATWSIVVVNLKTGEICVASATCIENFNLRSNLAIVAAEAGGGAAQSLISTITIRTLINDRLLEGVPPEEILDEIEVIDTLFQARQFGIVDLAGRAVTFSGSADGLYFGGVTGQIGDLVYAIQGNVLTGAPVISEAENALRTTTGDLGQRVMAAMEAAQAMGGDGRCSCDVNDPPSCGSPPPNFTKSAHVGFLLLARPGDEPFCDNFACARGDYYMVINKASLVASDPDPVFEIRAKFDQLRLALIGRPDGNLSTVIADTAEVEAGSIQTVSYVIDLHDVDDNILTNGGATITLEHDPRSAGLATLHQVTDHGNGTYTVEVLPGAEAGLDLLRLIVDDGIRPVTLWPPQALLHRAPAPTPLAAREDIAGLSTLGTLRSVFAQPNGLSAWALGDRGQGLELLELSRSAADQAFSVVGDFGIANFALAQLHRLWISQDGLRMTLSAKAPQDGKRHLYATSRPSLQDDFLQPELLVDLDSGFGETDPVLSDNELEIWFSTRRDGSRDLWHATRRTQDARWFPPQALAGINTPGEEASPVLSEHSTRLWFTRSGGSADSGLWTVAREADGNFLHAERVGGLAGEQANLAPLAVVPNLDHSQMLWLASQAGPGALNLTAAATTPGSLSLNPSSLSLATGGSLQFQLDAGSALALGNYTLFAGFADGQTVVDGLGVLPLRRAPGFSDVLRNLYGSPALQGGAGSLDANGKATVNWTLPAGFSLPPNLLDRNLAFSFVARGNGASLISLAAILRLTP